MGTSASGNRKEIFAELQRSNNKCVTAPNEPYVSAQNVSFISFLLVFYRITREPLNNNSNLAVGENKLMRQLR